MKIQSFLIQLFQKRHKFFQIHCIASRFTGIRIGRNHGSGMELEGAVHEELQGMNFQVLRIIFLLHALKLPYAFFRLPGGRDHIAAIDIDGQLSLLIQSPKAGVDMLMEFRISRNTGVKNCCHTDTDAEINPALNRSVNLRIRLVHCSVQNDRQLRRAFAHFSGDMSILTHIKA